MNTWLCVNAASGSNNEAAMAAVTQAFEAVNAAPARIIDLAEGALPQRRELAEGNVARLAIFAGDGTTNAVVTALEGWDGQILVLPGGTANLLARSLHGDRDALTIVHALPRLTPLRRHCIRSSQGTGLIEVLAGPGATWSDVREGLREGDLPGIAASTATAIRQSTAGPMVAIVEPRLGRPDGYSGVRIEAAEQGLLIEGYGADTVADYLRQGLALLRRDFRQGPHEELGAAPEILCRSLGDGPIELMIDGERRTGGREERFSLAELQVDLLASSA